MIICACLGSATNASIMHLDSSSRIITTDFDTFGFGDPNFGEQLFSTVSAPTEYNQWDYAEKQEIMNASIDSVHSSQATTTELVAYGSQVGSADPGDLNYEIFTLVGFHQYQVSFTLSESTTFALQATLEAQNAQSEVRLVQTNGDDPYLYTSVTNNGEQSINELITLEAGSYSFSLTGTLNAGGSGIIPPYTGSAVFDGSLRVIPSPSGFMAMGMVGMMTSRIRRR